MINRLKSKGHDYIRASKDSADEPQDSDYDSDVEKRKEAGQKLKYIDPHLLMKGVGRELNMNQKQKKKFNDMFESKAFIEAE